MVLLFLAQTINAFAQKLPTAKTTKEAFYSAGLVAFDYLAWLSAAETAAWRLKWLMIPLTLLVFYGSRKLYRSIKQSPSRFCGLRYARRGYLASALVPLLILVLIGVTVPKRLERHQWAIEAGFNAQGYRIDRALVEYREEFGTLPSDLKDLSRLPDTDGSIASALRDIEPNAYKASAEVAAVPTKKPQQLRGAVIRSASLEADETLNEGLSFTNYELRLPGYDKIPNTDDDMIVRDGLITKASEAPRRLGSSTAATEPAKR
jgi:hypothetical protein